MLDPSLPGEQEEGERGGQEPPGGPVGRTADPGAAGPAPDGEGRGWDAASAPSDVMILLRSPGVVLHHYLRALSEEGIPGPPTAAGTSLTPQR